jgi:AbrB family looped-hinge helix DNA binding protein
MPRAAITTRLTGNYQVSVPKPVRDALGLQLGDIFEVSAGPRGVVVLRPKQLTDKPIPEVTGTPAELRALKRVRAADARGETIPYEQYRAERAARLGGRGRQGRAKAAR